MAQFSKQGIQKSLRSIWEDSGMLVIFIVLFLLLAIFVPYFLTWRNMIGLGLSVSMVGMVSCTMLFCLASGDFDLSVENVIAFSGVTAAVIINSTNNVFFGIMLGVLGGGLIGFLNGFIIAKGRINALITTLAMSQIVRGLAFIVAGGEARSIGND